jgi:hypothetical protein
MTQVVNAYANGMPWYGETRIDDQGVTWIWDNTGAWRTANTVILVGSTANAIAANSTYLTIGNTSVNLQINSTSILVGGKPAGGGATGWVKHALLGGI